MRSYWTIGLVSALVLASACSNVCSGKSVSSISGEVRDRGGNLVPVTSVRVTQGSRTRACDTGLGAYVCRDLSAGDAELEVVAEGKTLTGQVSLTWEEGSEGCHTESETVDFELDARGCEPVTGDAVHVTVRDANDNVPEGTEVMLGWDDATLSNVPVACDRDEDVFMCAALTPYSTTYQVDVDHGDTFRRREVSVPAKDCSVSTQNVTIDL